ncbi:MAG TPA: hypothetical protein VHH13_11855 [Arthrobacter sp.]|nr:hypothetical protein [Arthrobacter sp.]
MVQFVLIILVGAAVGMSAWAIDTQRHAYGVLLLPASAITAATILWLILMFAGLGSEPGVDYLSWLLPMVLTVPVAWLMVRLVGRRRVAADVERLTEALR